MTRTAILAFCAVAICAVAASAATPPLRVVGFSQIGAFKVHGGSPAKAKAAFGDPISAKNTPSRDCLMRWGGLQISFYTLAHARQCQADTPFGIATITGAWVTDRGLRKGDTVSRARKLYPRALKPHFAGENAVGLIVKASQAVGDYGLAARVAGGKVVALVISDPQGGE
jgi:hypothetical protein